MYQSNSIKRNRMIGYFPVRFCVILTKNKRKFFLQTNFLAPTQKLHTTNVTWSETNNQPPFPQIDYYQSPIDWLKIKWKLLKLRKWDKDFNLNEFMVSSSYTIASVTHKIRLQSFNELEGLLTPFALSKLKRDILDLWNDEILRNIALRLPDIKLAVPTKVQQRTVALSPAKLCDIDMWFMAMKWQDQRRTKLLIIDVVARFTRDFNNTDWTISFFELRKYHELTYKDKSL